jgi:hypothetical protein
MPQVAAMIASPGMVVKPKSTPPEKTRIKPTMVKKIFMKVFISETPNNRVAVGVCIEHGWNNRRVAWW